MINFPSNRSAGTSQSVLSPDIDDQFEQAEVGDTVSIAELARFDRGNGPLSDTHDTVEWWATLELIRQTTGERIALSGRVHFVPRDALGPHSPHLLHDDEDFADYVAQHAISFGKIRLRISRLASAIKRRIPAKWARVDGVRCRVTDEVIPLLPPNTEIEFGWTYEAPFGPAREWLEMADLAQSYAIEEEEAFGEKVGSESLTALLDLVAAASYSLARAECELRVAPLAMRGIKVAQGGSKGGTATWDKIHREWEQVRTPEALRLAIHKRQRDPTRSQKDLASDIQAAWTLEDEPSFDWLLAFIRKAEKEGDLPKRATKEALRKK